MNPFSTLHVGSLIRAELEAQLLWFGNDVEVLQPERYVYR